MEETYRNFFRRPPVHRDSRYVIGGQAKTDATTTIGWYARFLRYSGREPWILLSYGFAAVGAAVLAVVYYSQLEEFPELAHARTVVLGRNERAYYAEQLDREMDKVSDMYLNIPFELRDEEDSAAHARRKAAARHYNRLVKLGAIPSKALWKSTFERDPAGETPLFADNEKDIVLGLAMQIDKGAVTEPPRLGVPQVDFEKPRLCEDKESPKALRSLASTDWRTAVRNRIRSLPFAAQAARASTYLYFVPEEDRAELLMHRGLTEVEFKKHVDMAANVEKNGGAFPNMPAMYVENEDDWNAVLLSPHGRDPFFAYPSKDVARDNRAAIQAMGEKQAAGIVVPPEPAENIGILVRKTTDAARKAMLEEMQQEA